MKRNPILLGVLSALVPGLGQMLAGQSIRGAAKLGYVSKCSLAPWSTLSMVGITLYLIGIVYIIQITIEK